MTEYVLTEHHVISLLRRYFFALIVLKINPGN